MSGTCLHGLDTHETLTRPRELMPMPMPVSVVTNSNSIFIRPSTHALAPLNLCLFVLLKRSDIARDRVYSNTQLTQSECSMPMPMPVSECCHQFYSILIRPLDVIECVATSGFGALQFSFFLFLFVDPISLVPFSTFPFPFFPFNMSFFSFMDFSFPRFNPGVPFPFCLCFTFSKDPNPPCESSPLSLTLSFSIPFPFFPFFSLLKEFPSLSSLSFFYLRLLTASLMSFLFDDAHACCSSISFSFFLSSFPFLCFFLFPFPFPFFSFLISLSPFFFSLPFPFLSYPFVL